MNTHPPQWASRFLEWYCNPDLLEEIQGDAYELYEERLKKSKRYANAKFVLDVIRFCRWSNIKRDNYLPGSSAAIWNLNFKMAARNAGKNKLIFVIKTSGLALAMAFSLLLTAYVVNELTYDHFHVNYDRIYRISSKINFSDHITHYAVTPLPIGRELKEKVPEVENYTRFMYEDKPIYTSIDPKNSQIFHDQRTLSVNSTFLKVFTYEFLSGNTHALNESNKLVVTETTALRLFGTVNALGKLIHLDKHIPLEVSAVIKDVPSNTHLKFDALISWSTFDRNDEWDNLNAYNYIVLREDASIEAVRAKLPKVLATFQEEVAKEYNATFEAPFEKIADIHFSGFLDEDIAEKKNKNDLFLLSAIIFLFVITGLINYLNLTLAELTSNLKKIGVVRVFGGFTGGHKKILISETIIAMLIVLPLAALLFYLSWRSAADYFSIQIDKHVLMSFWFVSISAGFIFFLFASTRINSYLLSKVNHVVLSLKGKLSTSQSTVPIRKFLVGMQLSFCIIMIALVFIVVDQFHFIQNSDKGFDSHHKLVVKFRSGNYSQITTFNEEIKKINGVAGVSISSYYPGMVESKYIFHVESEKGMLELLVPMMNCDYNYIDVMGIDVIKGRNFKEEYSTDIKGAYLINETAAKEFGWKDPIGKKISGPYETDGHEGEVVGLLRDFNFTSMHNKIEPLIIFHVNQDWGVQYVYLNLDPLHSADLIPTIEKNFKAQWPELPFEWEYLDSRYMSLYQKDYEMKNIFQTGLIISILISCLGIFSISALLASLRTKEMGIRKVVGAKAAQLFALHIKSFVQFLFISMLVAWPLIWYLSDQWLKNFAYHIKISIWYFIFPGLIVLAITLLTSCYHGIKSAMVSPVDTLKYE